MNDANHSLLARKADMAPDAYLLGLVVSSFLSEDSSYENGYSAYIDLYSNWLRHYSGNVYISSIDASPSLKSIFIKDYNPMDYINKNPSTPKDRIISVSDKIEELKNNYENNAHLSPQAVNIYTRFSLLLFILSLVVTSILFTIAFFVGAKYAKKRKDIK
jgi:hypothetical protein